jgi:lipopolysaccharide/colanic/teichoic acid biosynthesis glycosyltransferase
VKRAMDVVIASVGLLLGGPILVAAMAAIRLESPGHPIYRQRRIGRDGRPFDLYKLRTMVHGAEHMGAGMAVNEGDSRITRVGAFLRRTSLDELPNLVNVLRGDMSIVGPRPTIPVQVEQ